MKANNFPPGWDEDRVQKLLEHYDEQSDEEFVAEDEARLAEGHTVMEVPSELVPTIRELIAKRKAV
ncbi:MAG: hypothetical protein ABR507_00250 [Actinomycetota bacterium]